MEKTQILYLWKIDRTRLNSKYNTIVGCIYRLPSYSLKSFNALLTSRLSILHSEKKQLYIAGDFNVNIDPLVKNDINTQTFKNIFSSNFLFPLIDKPTRVTCHSVTIIDNIFSNASDIANTSRSGILRLSISDHYAVFCVNTSINVKADKQTVTKRNYSQKSISKFTKSLTNQSRISINILDVQSAFSWFQRVIDLHFEEHFPKQTFTMTYKTRLPWLTEKLRTQIKEKNAMHTQVILNPSNTLLNSEYKRLRNELTSSLRNCELQYYSNKLELNKSDLKKTWDVLRIILGKDTNNSKRTLKLNIKGKCVTYSMEIANNFNTFFVSIGSELAKDIVSTANPMSYIKNCNNSIVIPPVTMIEVRQTILALKNSSAGWDDLPALVAKQSIDSYIEPLMCLINRSFSDGIFPNELKLARVVPIFKSGDSTVLSNYRPISILSFFAKVFEKLLYKYLLNFLDDNNILYNYQFGFREKH